MNGFKKIYCRAFQFAFKMALPIMPYREPEVLGSIKAVPEVLKSKGIRRVLLVTDRGIAKLGLEAPLIKVLRKNNIKVLVYSDTVANPTVRNVERARMMYLRGRCQGLIAFGGGSSMDCAKAVGARLARPNKPLSKMEGILRVCRAIPILIAIPTTAGTGSETTLAAVITDERTHHKYPINDFALIPDYAVLEPRATVGLPNDLTATTGMDALTHAVEAYIGGSTNSYTRQMAIGAVKLIFDNIERAYNDGFDLEARANMLKASYMAGNAFTRSYVGYVHAVAHSLGGCYGTAHGFANAVLLPHVLEAYGEAAYKKLAELSRATGLSFSDNDERAAKAFIRKIKVLNRNMGIPRYIEGIKSEDISRLARYADKEANPLYPVPVLWDAKELEALYKRVQKNNHPIKAWE